MGGIPGALIGWIAGNAVAGIIIGSAIGVILFFLIFGPTIKMIGTAEFQRAIAEARRTGKDQYIVYRGRTMTIHPPVRFKARD